MWPRLLAQLLELLPHVSRLVPLADRYLTVRSTSEQAHEESLAALSSHIGNFTQSQTDLVAQLASQNRKLDHIIAQADLNRLELTANTAQLQAVTQHLKRLRLWVILSALFSALLLLAILGLLLHKPN